MHEHIKPLAKTELYPQVKAVLSGHLPRAVLPPAGLVILEAIEAGWFLLPRGRGHSYSHSQYFPLLGAFRKVPWAHTLHTLSELLLQRLHGQATASHINQLWTHPQGLHSFKMLATNTPQRHARLPHEWASGVITVDLVCQCLIDSYERCRNAEQLMTGLVERGLLLPECSIADQVDGMKALGEDYQIPNLLTSTRRMHLGTRDREALRSALQHSDAGTRFEAYLTRKADEQAEASRRNWLEVYASIHHVAAVIEDIGATEHLGTVNRRLKVYGGPNYRMHRESVGPAHTTERLLLSLGKNYYAGRQVEIQTHWAFKNWLIALSEMLRNTKPSFVDYMEAEKAAWSSIDLSGGMTEDRPPVRRIHDDFADMECA